MELNFLAFMMIYDDDDDYGDYDDANGESKFGAIKHRGRKL